MYCARVGIYVKIYVKLCVVFRATIVYDTSVSLSLSVYVFVVTDCLFQLDRFKISVLTN